MFKPTASCIISRTFGTIMWKYLLSLLLQGKNFVALILFNVKVLVLSVQIVMFNLVSHRQGGAEASMIIHHAFQRISQGRVIARGIPKIATTTIVTKGETIPTGASKYVGAENP